MQRTPQPASNLSDSVHQHLNMYAIAAGAAGVSMLALAQPAEAKVVYTNTGLIAIGWNSNYPLDLNHDGKSDFTIQNTRFYVTSGGLSSLSIRGAPGNKVGGNEGKYLFLAAALKRGARIGNVQNTAWTQFSSNARMAFSCTGFCTGGDWYDPGNWLNVTNRYLGLQFKIHGKIHYGWARLSVKQVHYGFAAHPFVALLDGYAYETIPNKAIIAGKTKGPDAVTFTPATLGHLAKGAPAISAWRGNGTTAATH